MATGINFGRRRQEAVQDNQEPQTGPLGQLAIPSSETERQVRQLTEADIQRDYPLQRLVTLSLAQVSRIRYSQVTVSAHTSEGTSLEKLVGDIRFFGWRQDSPIRVVVMPDGGKTSLDNRRLKALKTIYKETPYIKMRISVLLLSSEGQASPRSKGQVLSRFNYMESPVRKRKAVEKLTKEAGLEIGSQGHLVVARTHGTNTPEKRIKGLTDEDVDGSAFGFSESPLVMTQDVRDMAYRLKREPRGRGRKLNFQ